MNEWYICIGHAVILHGFKKTFLLKKSLEKTPKAEFLTSIFFTQSRTKNVIRKFGMDVLNAKQHLLFVSSKWVIINVI